MHTYTGYTDTYLKGVTGFVKRHICTRAEGRGGGEEGLKRQSAYLRKQDFVRVARVRVSTGSQFMMMRGHSLFLINGGTSSSSDVKTRRQHRCSAKQTKTSGTVDLAGVSVMQSHVRHRLR